MAGCTADQMAVRLRLRVQDRRRTVAPALQLTGAPVSHPQPPLASPTMADDSHSHSHEPLAEQHGEAAELDLSQSVSLHDLQSSVQLPLRDLDASVLADIQRAYPQLTDLNLESNGQNSRTGHYPVCEQRCIIITHSSL